jgi:hypothetical protein
MTIIASRAGSFAKAFVRSWVTWVALGLALGAITLLGVGAEPAEADKITKPDGSEIENAVARAEAEANAVQTGR